MNEIKPIFSFRQENETRFVKMTCNSSSVLKRLPHTEKVLIYLEKGNGMERNGTEQKRMEKFLSSTSSLKFPQHDNSCLFSSHLIQVGCQQEENEISQKRKVMGKPKALWGKMGKYVCKRMGINKTCLYLI